MTAALKQTRWLWTCLCLCLTFAAPRAAAETPAKTYVILWFDTEDYILPASDDAALKVAELLTRAQVRATFKVVGEKARTLERRQRNDVIAALKKHEIGYHSNWHSVHPSPAAYLANLGWDDGVAEFERREGPGRDDVRRIFGVAPSCYGQPGSSWGPQAYGVMKRWGMEVYLDAGSHVNLDGKPHYYGGMLNLYKLTHTQRAKLTGPKDLAEAEEKFLATRKQLQAEGGGIVSIYYHPCEFVHKEFWDAANFRQGANPPRERWQLPAAKTEEESKIAYQILEGYVRFMKRFPDVQFITASKALKVYPDHARGRKFSRADLQAIATAVTDQIGFQARADYALSASEVFVLLNEYVAERKPATLVLTNTPYGPSNPVVELAAPVTTDWSQFQRTAVDVADFVKKQGRIPTAVWLGSTPVPPEAYLAALARVTLQLLDKKPAPASIEVKPAKLAAAGHVAEDAPNLWGWVIFPRGFHAAALMELAKRQAWTLKPALLQKDSRK